MRKLIRKLNVAIKWTKGIPLYVSYDPKNQTEPKHPLTYHTSRVLFITLLAIVFRLLFPFATHYEMSDYEVGMVAPEDVTAPFSYSVYKNPKELAREREERAEGVHPVLEYVPNSYDSVMADVNSFFENAESLSRKYRELVRALNGSGSKAKKEQISSRLDSLKQSAVLLFSGGGSLVDDDSFALLMEPENLKRMKKETVRFFEIHLKRGVITSEIANKLGDVPVASVRNETEVLNDIDDFFTIEQVYDNALRYDIEFEEDVLRSLFLSIVNRFFKPNVIYNEVETARRREHARNQVSPIKAQVLEGEKIIAEGYRITQPALDRYVALNEEMARRQKGVTQAQIYLPILGGILINFFILGIFALYLNYYRRSVYASFSNIALFGFTFLIVMGLSSIIARFPQVPVYLVPIAIGSILIAVLFDGRLALVATLVLSILLGGQENFGYNVLFVSFIGGVSATLSTRLIRSRGQFYRSILYLATGYVISITAVGLIRLVPWTETLQSCGWGVINSIFSTFFAMGLLPLLEYSFNVTTDISLLELSDFNHPLMKELALKAPGTWAHSLAVSNLAESAAERIGANSLLVRVGSYYHDIGKIAKPYYFVENQRSDYNPHDYTSPSISALIIESHVKKGIEMAQNYNLPQCIIDFIPQHHGTSMISFFYDKAKEQTINSSVDPYQYRYPGPKPQSKEAVILMISDSIESISRTIKDPSPQKIKYMIEAAIKSKVEAGQLDEADITFNDLRLIQEEFLKVIISTLHHRIEYPQQVGANDEEVKKTSGRINDGAREQDDAASASPVDERT